MAKYIYRLFGIPVFTKEVIHDVTDDELDDTDDDAEDDELDIELDDERDRISLGSNQEINTDPIPPMFGFAPHGGMHYNWNE